MGFSLNALFLIGIVVRYATIKRPALRPTLSDLGRRFELHNLPESGTFAAMMVKDQARVSGLE
jgi:hypothetical protein